MNDVTYSSQNATSINDHLPLLQMLLSEAKNGDLAGLLIQTAAKKGVLFSSGFVQRAVVFA